MEEIPLVKMSKVSWESHPEPSGVWKFLCWNDKKIAVMISGVSPSELSTFLLAVEHLYPPKEIDELFRKTGDTTSFQELRSWLGLTYGPGDLVTAVARAKKQEEDLLRDLTERIRRKEAFLRAADSTTPLFTPLPRPSWVLPSGTPAWAPEFFPGPGRDMPFPFMPGMPPVPYLGGLPRERREGWADVCPPSGEVPPEAVLNPVFPGSLPPGVLNPVLPSGIPPGLAPRENITGDFFPGRNPGPRMTTHPESGPK